MANEISRIKDSITAYKEEEEERLVQYLSKKYEMPAKRISDLNISIKSIQTIKEKEAIEAQMAIWKKVNKKIEAALVNPNNKLAKQIIESLRNRGYKVNLSLVSNKTLKHILQYYKEIRSTSYVSPGMLNITNEEIEEATKHLSSIEEIKTFLQNTSEKLSSRKTSKNIEHIIIAATSIGASDIHIEATETGGVVRFRIDGVLEKVLALNREDFKRLIIRMKIISGMKITTKGTQDGGFVVKLGSVDISVRASIVPGDKGGSFVLRLLDPRNVIHDIEKIGIHKSILELFRKQTRKPNGLILTTGPTGSGKTTTLYSFLNATKNTSNKVITLEDPIEYRLEGIVQTQINAKYSFADGLRSILRQDPDVILVGEIRDSEVAEISMQASLTGHLVFSTLHTNDSIGALPRLEQLGVDSKLFARAINIIIAQRLVRKLCKNCSKETSLSKKQKEKIENIIKNMPSGYKEDFSFSKIRESGGGCNKCIGGYKGRVGVFEVIEVNDEIGKAILEKKSIDELKNIANKQDLPFMEDDAVWKLLNGITSIDEINRIIGTDI